MSESRMYVRIRGRVHGPFDDRKLRHLVARGQLNRIHELSEDGNSWQVASEYPELFDNAPDQSPTDSGSVSSQPAEVLSAGAVVSETSRGQAQDQWRYAINGVQDGPVDSDSLQRMFAKGTLPRDTLVWKDGMEEWASAESIPQFAVAFQATQAVAGTNASGGEASDLGAICQSLMESTGWSKLVVVATFIFSMLGLLSSLGMLLTGCVSSSTSVVISAIFGFVVFGLLLTVGIKLVSLNGTLAVLKVDQSVDSMLRFANAHQRYWHYWGILNLIALSALMIGIVTVLAVAVVTGDALSKFRP